MRSGPYEVVIARTKEGNEKLRARLEVRGVGAFSVETIALEDPEDWTPVDDAIKRIPTFDWVAFTSPRGVSVFAHRLRRLSLDPRGMGTRFAAVGTKTESALKKLGIVVDYVPSEFLTAALAEGLPRTHGLRVLLLRADLGGKEIVEILEKRGFEVSEVAAYHTRFVRGAVEAKPLKNAKAIVFASPSEVTGFRRRLGEAQFLELATRTIAICIGPVTSRAAKDAGFKSVVFASEHTLEGLVEKVGEMIVHA
jgi:uroporphyrinogen-III synthase